MKTLLAILALGSIAHAAPTVKITSFYQIGGAGSRLAELCGKVEGMTEKFVIVKVTADPNTKNPGIYNVWVGQDGAFCTTLVSHRGRAEAEIRE